MKFDEALVELVGRTLACYVLWSMLYFILRKTGIASTIATRSFFLALGVGIITYLDGRLVLYCNMEIQKWRKRD